MDDLGQDLKERLHFELDGAEPSPGFWDELESRRTAHRRRKVVGRIAAVAASVALLAVGTVSLFDQFAPGPRLPPVTSEPAPAPIPPHPTRVAEGTLTSGDSWTLDIGGPGVWQEVQGDPGDLCVRTTISRTGTATTAGSYSVNCAPREREGVFDTDLDQLVAVRNLPQAHTIEFRYDDQATRHEPLRLHGSNYGVTWAIADLSDTAPEDLFDGLNEIAVLDPDGEELITTLQGQSGSSRSGSMTR